MAVPGEISHESLCTIEHSWMRTLVSAGSCNSLASHQRGSWLCWKTTTGSRTVKLYRPVWNIPLVHLQENECLFIFGCFWFLVVVVFVIVSMWSHTYTHAVYSTSSISILSLSLSHTHTHTHTHTRTHMHTHTLTIILNVLFYFFACVC